jgi:hypothetical protein
MTSSFIPQRIKRAKQQITVKLYQDQLAMLDKYGRFIDDSRDYIISQASGGSSGEASVREPKSGELCREYGPGSVSVSQRVVSG